MMLVAICLVVPQRIRLSGTVIEPFEVLPGRIFQEQRSVSILHWSHILLFAMLGT